MHTLLLRVSTLFLSVYLLYYTVECLFLFLTFCMFIFDNSSVVTVNTILKYLPKSFPSANLLSFRFHQFGY